MPFLYDRTSITTIPVGYSKGKLASELKPKNSGVPIDVIRDFPWTLTPLNDKTVANVPVIYLNEYYQIESQLNQALLPYGKGKAKLEEGTSTLSKITSVINTLAEFVTVGKDTPYLYEGLFDHLHPGFKYVFPNFSKTFYSVTNNWQRTDILDTLLGLSEQVGDLTGSGLKSIGKTIGKNFGAGIQGIDFLNKLPRKLKDLELFNLASSNPTVGLMDPPSIWQSSSQRTTTFEFPLYNINIFKDSTSTDTIVKNWELCYLLTYQNLVNKKNFYTGIPPVFYEVIIPGIHYCKASYMSNISISNVGNVRNLTLNVNGNTNVSVNVPDAYMISITLTDLLMPSKNLLNVSLDLKVTSGNIANTNSVVSRSLQ
jgi:hypothetical protein